MEICSVQTFLRRNHDDSLSGNSIFQYGKPVSNQRIEAWCSVLKQDTLQTGLITSKTYEKVEYMMIVILFMLKH